jgi:hypothetical protein
MFFPRKRMVRSSKTSAPKRICESIGSELRVVYSTCSVTGSETVYGLIAPIFDMLRRAASRIASRAAVADKLMHVYRPIPSFTTGGLLVRLP